MVGCRSTTHDQFVGCHPGHVIPLTEANPAACAGVMLKSEELGEVCTRWIELPAGSSVVQGVGQRRIPGLSSGVSDPCRG